MLMTFDDFHISVFLPDLNVADNILCRWLISFVLILSVLNTICNTQVYHIRDLHNSFVMPCDQFQGSKKLSSETVHVIEPQWSGIFPFWSYVV